MKNCPADRFRLRVTLLVQKLSLAVLKLQNSRTLSCQRSLAIVTEPILRHASRFGAKLPRRLWIRFVGSAEREQFWMISSKNEISSYSSQKNRKCKPMEHIFVLTLELWLRFWKKNKLPLRETCDTALEPPESVNLSYEYQQVHAHIGTSNIFELSHQKIVFFGL